MKNPKHTKKVISISVDKQLDNLMNELFGNKSKYIEWLIYQDMLKNLPDENILKKLVL